MSVAVDIRHGLGPFDLDVGFRIERPGVTALFGPSGAGKTTVVHVVAGLLRPAAGRVEIDGRVVVDTETGLFVPARERAVGYVFQDGRLFPHLSVEGNLRFGERRASGRSALVTFDEMVDLLGLGSVLDRRPASLSGGERQRVALGRAILARPRVLLLDEPLAALDRERKEEILPLLGRLPAHAAMPMIYVSHDIEEVARLADDVVVLREGRVQAQGSVFDVMSRPELFPRTSGTEAGAVLEARIELHDETTHLTELRLGTESLWVPRVRAAEGETVRLRVLARDVMLATTEPRGISANNVLRGTVQSVHRSEGAGVDVQLACGETRLLARITHRSLARLDLTPGAPIYAVIKSVAVDRPSG